MGGGSSKPGATSAISSRVENSHSVDAGFSYTTRKGHVRCGFLSRTVVDGVNTDRKFRLGGYFDIPLQAGSK